MISGNLNFLTLFFYTFVMLTSIFKGHFNMKFDTTSVFLLDNIVINNISSIVFENWTAKSTIFELCVNIGM